MTSKLVGISTVKTKNNRQPESKNIARTAGSGCLTVEHHVYKNLAIM